MASSEFTPLTFGFHHPTEEDFGRLAETLVHLADINLKQSRSRAILYLVPSLFFYIFFSGGVAVILWSVGAHLKSPAFLITTAVSFLILALLGQHYQMEDTSAVLEARFRIHRIMLLQAYTVKLITALFFIFPFRIIRNLARLFPRKARVSPEVLNLAVNLTASLDVPIRYRELKAVLPPHMTDRVIQEALILLKWSKLVETLHRGEDVFIFPTDKHESVVNTLSSDPENRTFMSGLFAEGDIAASTSLTDKHAGRETTAEAAASSPAVTPGPGRSVPIPPGSTIPPSPPTQTSAPGTPQKPVAPAPVSPEVAGTYPSARRAPRWLQPVARHPMASLLLAFFLLLVSLGTIKTVTSWYAKLPVRVEPVDLLSDADTDSITFMEGNFYLGKGDYVEKSDSLAAVFTDNYSLQNLIKLWGEEPGIDNAGGKYRVSYRSIWHMEPDPGGTYLLVYGKWKHNPGPVSGTGTGWAIVDPVERTLYPASLLGREVIKGWWDEGRLLVTRPGVAYEKGGGQRLDSENLSYTMMAKDVGTGQSTTLYQPKENFFGFAGWENGKRVFLAADWESEEMTDINHFTFSEYHDFEKIRSFSWPLRGYRPLPRQVELDATGQYWIISMEWPAPPANMSKGWRYSIWVLSRSGARRMEATDRTKGGPLFLNAFSDGGRSLFTYTKNRFDPKFKARVIRRR